MKIGDAFFFSSDIDIHLWIAISNPDDKRGVVIVSVTTQEKYKDSTCQLRAGDHPRIKHDSLVYFKRARILSSGDIEKLVQKNAIQFDQPVSKDVLERIHDGAGLTRFMPSDCQDLLEEQGHITIAP